MAVSFGASSGYGFFDKIGPVASAISKDLLEKGATVEIQFQALKIANKGKQYMHPLPVNSTAVIKGIVPEEMKGTLRNGVEKFLFATWKALYPQETPPEEWLNLAAGLGSGIPQANVQNIPKPKVDELTPEPPAKLTFGNEGEAGVTTQLVGGAAGLKSLVKEFKLKHPGQFMAMMGEIMGGTPTSTTGGKVYPKGTAYTAVPLTQATMLNQPVKGTAATSIYRVIALGDRIRMACRTEPGALSVRVEGPLNTLERAALKELGFTDHGMKGYLSCHYDLGDIPAVRVLGCIFFHPGLKFTVRIDSLEQIG